MKIDRKLKLPGIVSCATNQGEGKPGHVTMTVIHPCVEHHLKVITRRIAS